MKSIIILLLLFLSAAGYAQTAEKREKLLRTIAKRESQPYFATITARLKTGINKDLAMKQLDTLLSLEKGDMFWMYGLAGLYFSLKNDLPDAVRIRIKNVWRIAAPYRGDTENHFLMYYSALYLFSGEWRDMQSDEWFLGKSSQQIHKESREYLMHWIDEVTTKGMVEFDSPRYMYYVITPLLLLAEYGDDQDKQRFKMLLDIVLADYASDYYFGNYAGAHSRIGNELPFDNRKSEVAAYGDYFFSDSLSVILPDVVFAAMSTYKIPDVIVNIAREKKYPYASIERKMSRQSMRPSPMNNRVVLKKFYATKEYAVGSIDGGLVSPIQQRSWQITLHTDSADNIITGLHPYMSGNELAQYFPEEPQWMLKQVEAVKKGYADPAKWVGGSPFEHIDQQMNRLRVHYSSVPKNVKPQYAKIRLPRWMKVTFDESETMIKLTAVFDNVTITIQLPRNATLQSDDRSHIVEIPFSAGGCEYTVNCSSAEFIAESNNNALFDSPYINSEYGSGIITLMYGADKYIYNFHTNTITKN